VAWVEIFVVLFVSHAFGDYMLQTDWQAMNKRGGLGRDAVARRALLSHVTVYTAAFVPAGIWLAGDLGPAGLVLAAVGIFVPHMVQDDGRLLTVYIRAVKGDGAADTPPVYTAVDQSLHVIVLFATALVLHWATT
jgi:hypothetical protein